MNRIKPLDSLRGICALMLVIFHFSHKETCLTDNFFVRRAELLVDFFFVLSGFVISLNYYKSNKTFTKDDFFIFLKKRFIRLYPLLLYTVLIYFGYEMLIKTFVNQKNPADTGEQLWQLFDSLTFLNSTPLLGTTNGMNGASWSISAEMFSYIVFGLLMILHHKSRNLISLIIIIGAIIFVYYKNQFLFTGDFGFVRGMYCFLVGYFTLCLSLIHI